MTARSRPAPTVRLRLLILALAPLVVLMPFLLLLGMTRWTSDYDKVLAANVQSDLRIAEQYLSQLQARTGEELHGEARSLDFARAAAGGLPDPDFLERRRAALGLDFLYYLPGEEAAASRWPVIAAAAQGARARRAVIGQRVQRGGGRVVAHQRRGQRNRRAGQAADLDDFVGGNVAAVIDQRQRHAHRETRGICHVERIRPGREIPGQCSGDRRHGLQRDVRPRRIGQRQPGNSRTRHDRVRRHGRHLRLGAVGNQHRVIRRQRSGIVDQQLGRALPCLRHQGRRGRNSCFGHQAQDGFRGSRADNPGHVGPRPAIAEEAFDRIGQRIAPAGIGQRIEKTAEAAGEGAAAGDQGRPVDRPALGHPDHSRRRRPRGLDRLVGGRNFLNVNPWGKIFGHLRPPGYAPPSESVTLLTRRA
ncbi:hypothetical protein [Mangrovicoccus ximenensis]|uniref:hypothetical protein n=1 Tax=Mangrovicoccus ximenensis TaxID=1911570 RepID=UPI00191C6C79|nr:hypothetical protein [Mangrovicoccus ximenensis]